MADYSQNKESIMLKDIFSKIGTHNNFAVEFGASDGFWYSNIRMFIEEGWKSLQMEGGDKAANGVVKEFITAENINDLFDKYSVPSKIDLLSIDIDGNDYWVWKNINRDVNVVVIEYNSNFSIDEAVVLEYDPNYLWNQSYAYSASYKALKELGESKGYYLYAENHFINLIFVKKEFEKILPSILVESELALPHFHHSRDLQGKKFIKI
jgi:hypothetical protein